MKLSSSKISSHWHYNNNNFIWVRSTYVADNTLWPFMVMPWETYQGHHDCLLWTLCWIIICKLHTEVMSGISRVYECRLCMDLPEYYAWFVLSVSSLLLSVMVRSCHACINVVFVPRASFLSMLCSGSSSSQMRQRAGPIACTRLPVGVDVQSSWNI